MNKGERIIKFIISSICIHISAIICGILGAIPLPLIGFLLSSIIITINSLILFALYEKLGYLLENFFKIIFVFISCIFAMGCGGIISSVKYLAGLGTIGAIGTFFVMAEFVGWIIFLIARFGKDD